MFSTVQNTVQFKEMRVNHILTEGVPMIPTGEPQLREADPD